MPKKSVPKPSKPPKARARYSIGEWYGVGFEELSKSQRIEWAQRELKVDGLTGMPCPFMERTCNKKGGVCSIRLYSGFQREKGAKLLEVNTPVSVCPNRFEEARRVVTWVSETLLGTSDPLVLSEIGFLDRFKVPDTTPKPASQGKKTSKDDTDQRDFIGRIDNVLIHPEKQPVEWCPLEIQAVYFSGKSMRQEFAAIAKSDGDIYFPVAHRRPDWRSSGPKRLLPQLQTKVPTIRTWGKKMAVVIDRPFFSQLVGLERQEHLSNSEIVWFVMDYERTQKGWKMVPGEFVMTTLETSVKALTGGTPLSREAFEKQLITKISKDSPNHFLARLP